jgi:eukaryotic-like serine/threonine-protein kinase
MSEPFDALAEALSGRYRIDRQIGVGGMATVYVAHDLKHDRDVAIKVLNPSLAAALGADRFASEIRTIAHLKHPHILPLFDSGSANSLLFYVMPFIEGESLRDRITREHMLPIADVVKIVRELADALAYAHAAGVIHRDVKPDNVLTSGRHVFLSDFGISYALAPAERATLTATGTIVGTPAYMAPEQVASGQAELRSDIYGLGALAYELLTGTPPFTGSPQDIVVAQLTKAPADISQHRPDTPASLADLVMRCLNKNPEDRWQRAEELLPVLDALASATTLSTATPRARPVHRMVFYGLAAIITIASASAAWYVSGLRKQGQLPSLTIGKIYRVTTEPGLELDPAISPDGRAIAYASGFAGQLRIYVRQIAAGRSVALTEETTTGSQRSPQWSPDGSRIVFQSTIPPIVRESVTRSMRLFQVPALGGTAARITVPAPANFSVGPSWTPDGSEVVFGGESGIYVMSADRTDSPRLLIPGDNLHSPRWSPDGSKLAYVSEGVIFVYGEEMLGNVETSRVFVFDVRTGQISQISTGWSLDVSPAWLPDSRTLLFISNRDGGRDVYSTRLNADGARDGEPTRLTSGLNAHGIGISRDGTLLAYASYTSSVNIWAIDIPSRGVRSVQDAQQITFGNQRIEKLVLSPDGQWLAYDSDRNGQADVWKVRLAGGTPEQLTKGPNPKFVNEWSPDGQEIVIHTNREGSHRDVLVISADGTKTETVVATPAEEQHSGWSPDGNSIVFDSAPALGGDNQAYIASRARRGEPWGKPRRLTSHGSTDPKWSPDGRLIAFCTEGQLRTIAPDGTNERVLVTPRGETDISEAAYPVWSRDSRTIYFKAYDSKRQSSIWAISVDGGAPQLLVRFDDPAHRSLRREFATDGKRFFFTISGEESDLWAMELTWK